MDHTCLFRSLTFSAVNCVHEICKPSYNYETVPKGIQGEPDYNLNIRHCSCSLDADLIVLGLLEISLERLQSTYEIMVTIDAREESARGKSYRDFETRSIQVQPA